MNTNTQNTALETDTDSLVKSTTTFRTNLTAGPLGGSNIESDDDDILVGGDDWM